MQHSQDTVPAIEIDHGNPAYSLVILRTGGERLRPETEGPRSAFNSLGTKRSLRNGVCVIMRIATLLTAALLSGMLSGCAIGPKYHRPLVQTPNSFSRSGRHLGEETRTRHSKLRTGRIDAFRGELQIVILFEGRTYEFLQLWILKHLTILSFTRRLLRMPICRGGTSILQLHPTLDNLVTRPVWFQSDTKMFA